MEIIALQPSARTNRSALCFIETLAFVILCWNVHETWFILSCVSGNFDSINEQNTLNYKGSSLSGFLNCFADWSWDPGQPTSWGSSWLLMPRRIQQWQYKFLRLIAVSEISFKNRCFFKFWNLKKNVLLLWHNSNGPCWSSF